MYLDNIIYSFISFDRTALCANMCCYLQVKKHEQHLLNYMIFLRITPFLPNWFINITAPVIGVPMMPFFLGTLLGTLLCLHLLFLYTLVGIFSSLRAQVHDTLFGIFFAISHSYS